MMNMSFIQLPSAWGSEVSQRWITNHAITSATLVVLFPGKNYSCELPLLYYAQQSATEHQYDVLALEYGYQRARTELREDEVDQVIEECLSAINHVKSKYNQFIFISKSLGNLIAGEVSKRLTGHTVKHLYLTPIDKSIPYIKESTGYVIYGTNDGEFNHESIREIQGLQHIHAYPVLEASHSLEVDTVAHSLLVMREIVLIYNHFFEQDDKELNQVT